LHRCCCLPHDCQPHHPHSFPTRRSSDLPEGLVERILTIATNPTDWVLDSFAGTGTTGAAAHKMGRRWIMVELGEHCHTHIIPRLDRKSTRLNSSHQIISYAVFCLKKNKQ